MAKAKNKPTVEDLLAFIAASPTASHAVAEAESRMKQGGFKPLDERERWAITPGAAFTVKRHDSAILALRVGSGNPAEVGFRMIGAHTDSPGFRLKPRALYTKAGYLQCGVEIYGGPILATWADRDLGLAGKLVIRGKDDTLRSELIRLDDPVFRISLLPIHFNREVNDQGLVLNKQEHLAPVIGLYSDSSPKTIEALIAPRLELAADAIAGWELELYDLQPGRIAGLDQGLVISPRLDNLGMCHAALSALLAAAADTEATRLVVLYDSEEVGNVTPNGAASSFLLDVLRRIALLQGCDEEDLRRTLARSFFISADQAHAVNPNFTDKYERDHQCFMNQGPVIKINAQRKYATTAESGVLFADLCRRAGVPCQKFVNRTDMAGGSTIGPVSSANLGISAVDVGNAILSMHSIREVGGSRDQEMMIAAFREFFNY